MVPDSVIWKRAYNRLALFIGADDKSNVLVGIFNVLVQDSYEIHASAPRAFRFPFVIHFLLNHHKLRFLIRHAPVTRNTPSQTKLPPCRHQHGGRRMPRRFTMQLDINIEGIVAASVAAALSPERLQPIIDKNMESAVTSAIQEQFN